MTVRPDYRPLYQAIVDTLAVDAADLIGELERRTIDEGFGLRVSSVLDGFLETRWFNLVTRETDDSDIAHPDRVVRLRFWVDPVGPLGSQLTSEAVYRRVSDPSLSPREVESMVPPGHEGDDILMRILVGVRERFGG